jgi:hypothetical protein
MQSNVNNLPPNWFTPTTLGDITCVKEQEEKDHGTEKRQLRSQESAQNHHHGRRSSDGEPMKEFESLRVRRDFNNLGEPTNRAPLCPPRKLCRFYFAARITPDCALRQLPSKPDR